MLTKLLQKTNISKIRIRISRIGASIVEYRNDKKYSKFKKEQATLSYVLTLIEKLHFFIMCGCRNL